MKQEILLAIALFTISLPVRAEWGLTEAKMRNCANHIYTFEQNKLKHEMDFFNQFTPGTRGPGREISAAFARYMVALEYVETISQCEGEYHAQAIARQLYEQNYINQPYISDYLEIW